MKHPSIAHVAATLALALVATTSSAQPKSHKRPKPSASTPSASAPAAPSPAPSSTPSPEDAVPQDDTPQKPTPGATSSQKATRAQEDEEGAKEPNEPSEAKEPKEPKEPKAAASLDVDPETGGGGGAGSKFVLTPYGLVQGQLTHDSTQSFQNGQGNAPIARSGAAPGQPPPYAGQHGRLTMTARHTILGFRVKSPAWHAIVASARLEGDFEGAPSPTSPPGTAFGNTVLNSSEASYEASGPFRIRQAYALIETPVIDFLAGQSQTIFGWQPFFYPNSANNLGIPGHTFDREMQLKISHVFKTSALNVEVAAGAFRPPQRDSEIPDGQAGLRLAINDWKGIQNGNKVVPAQIAVSGAVRTFKVQGYGLPAMMTGPVTMMTTPLQDHGYTENGAGVSIDALLPIIPGDNPDSPGNTLTVVGEAAMGYGISDLYQNLTFGVQTFAIQQSNGVGTPLAVDPGIVTFDPNTGQLRAIDVRSFLVNVQYVLPGLDNVDLSAIYSYLDSDNVDRLSTVTQSQTGSFSKIFIKQRYIEGTLHVWVTPAYRLSFCYGNTVQTFLDGLQETNHRLIFKMNYAF